MEHQESTHLMDTCAFLQSDSIQVDSSNDSIDLRSILSFHHTRSSNVQGNVLVEDIHFLNDTNNRQQLQRNANETTTFDILSEALELSNEINHFMMSEDPTNYDLDVTSSSNKIVAKATMKQ